MTVPVLILHCPNCKTDELVALEMKAEPCLGPQSVRVQSCSVLNEGGQACCRCIDEED